MCIALLRFIYLSSYALWRVVAGSEAANCNVRAHEEGNSSGLMQLGKLEGRTVDGMGYFSNNTASQARQSVEKRTDRAFSGCSYSSVPTISASTAAALLPIIVRDRMTQADGLADGGQRNDDMNPLHAVPYTLALPPKPMNERGTGPNASEVFHRLIRRRKFRPDRRHGRNVLVASFGQFFTHDIFTSVGKFGNMNLVTTSEGAIMDNGGKFVTLAPLYGKTQLRTLALREDTRSGGKSCKMRTGADGRLPLVADIRKSEREFEVACSLAVDADCLSSKNLYACGDPACNQHPGLLFWTELLMLEHNRICDGLRDDHKGINATEDELFLIARKINTLLYKQILFQHHAGVLFKGAVKLPLHKPSVSEEFMRLGFGATLPTFNVNGTVPPQGFFMEFNQIYHWHQQIPEELKLSAVGAENDLLFANFLYKPAEYAARNFSEWAKILAHTEVGEFGARNWPAYMQGAFEKFLLWGRVNGVRSFNDYRAHVFGLKRLSSFEDFGASDEITKELKELYGHPDHVDFFVGFQIEERYPWWGYVSTLKWMLGSQFYFTETLQASLLPWAILLMQTQPHNVSGLSAKEIQFLNEFDIDSLFERHDVNLGCRPFFIPHAPEKSQSLQGFFWIIVTFLNALTFPFSDPSALTNVFRGIMTSIFH